MQDEDGIPSQLHRFSAGVYFSYSKMPGKLFLRKEVRHKYTTPNIPCYIHNRPNYFAMFQVSLIVMKPQIITATQFSFSSLKKGKS